MIIDAYKSYKAVQWDGDNGKEIKDFSGKIPFDWGMMPIDWLVYSKAKDEYKVYTDQDFQEKFLTKEDLVQIIIEISKELNLYKSNFDKPSNE